MQTESSVEIERPIAEAFEYTYAHIADWSITIVARAVVARARSATSSG